MHVLIFFIKVLELFRCLLGTFLTLPRLSWTAWDPKTLKNTYGFVRFLQMQVFDTLKILMDVLGASWPLLGRSVPKVTRKNRPKSNPKAAQKSVQHWTQTTKKTKIIFSYFGDSDWAPKRLRTAVPGHGQIWTGPSTKLLALRWPKMVLI